MKKRINNNIQKSMVQAFLICWALQLITGMTVRNPLTVLLFLCALWAESAASEADDKKKMILKAALSAILSAGVTAFSYGGAAAEFDNGLFKLLAGIIIFAGMFFLFDLVIRVAVSFSMKKGAEDNGDLGIKTSTETSRWIPAIKTDDKWLFIIVAALCFICWLPYFLYEYPGIMTADSLVQYEQIVGVKPYSNHHPIVHTLCIAFFYRIGFAITGDANKSIAFYTVAQMVFMSFCCGAVAVRVQKITESMVAPSKGDGGYNLTLWTVLCAAFFALVPFNAVFAVTIWKDVPFAGFTMLLVCCIYDMTGAFRKDDRGKLPAGIIIRFAFFSLAFCLFRSNALYAYVLSIVFFIIYFGKKQIAVPLVMAAVIAVSIFIKGPLMNSMNIEQADFTESLSVPLQMIARVIVNDREISEGDMELIDAVIDRTYIHELYAPDFADNMKELVRAGHPDVIEKNKGEYLKLWLRLFFRYPGDYIAGWFDVVGGYVYPDVSYDVGNIDGVMGNDLGLTSTPLIGGKVVIKLKEIFIKLGSFVPLYGMLWCAGAYTWFLVITLIAVIRSGKYTSFWLMTVVPLSLIFTLCIAAPLVDFRYAYGVVMTMPIYAALCAIIVTEKKRG